MEWSDTVGEVPVSLCAWSPTSSPGDMNVRLECAVIDMIAKRDAFIAVIRERAGGIYGVFVTSLLQKILPSTIDPTNRFSVEAKVSAVVCRSEVDDGVLTVWVSGIRSSDANQWFKMPIE